MAPIGHRHAACVNRLNRPFSSGVGDAAMVRCRTLCGSTSSSEPQPDLALLRAAAPTFTPPPIRGPPTSC